MVRMREVIDAAIGKWPEILKRYGLDEKLLTGRHGPCPICKDGTDRFRFDNQQGTGSYHCNKCGAGYGLKLLAGLTGRLPNELAAELASMVGNLPAASWTPAPDMRKRIGWITSQIRHASEVPAVMAYLAGRGLKPVSHVYAMESLRYYEERKLVGEYAAMVTGFRSPTGDLLTYHLTYVHAGEKAAVASPKKLLTPLGKLGGGALRLTRVYPAMGIAEGVETALAVMRDFRIPCWAAANAGMMEKFVPPAEVKSLTIFADNDASFTGQRAAYALAYRLAGQGITTDVKVPAQVGDFADRREG